MGSAVPSAASRRSPDRAPRFALTVRRVRQLRLLERRLVLETLLSQVQLVRLRKLRVTDGAARGQDDSQQAADPGVLPVSPVHEEAPRIEGLIDLSSVLLVLWHQPPLIHLTR